MKNAILLFLLSTSLSFAQKDKEEKDNIDSYVTSIDNLTQKAAFELVNRVNHFASTLNKEVSVAILDASGSIIVLTSGDSVGPHNTEASRRKAYTSLSTKTATLQLLRNAEQNSDTKNLNSLPELLLLSGGSPIYYKGNIIGSIGVSGGGGPENDDLIAKSAAITEIGITTTK
ncbi:heme-binding protein [Flavobacterium gelidilacus]|jgi:uncharacterized protein GlcG (DUF336 family)|uniref:heme-binding protein n=1 Tax=Flavobacterium gelidilacus TaxID=206041 RepID=UPI0003F62C9B|nr:heme-binding protein [Flavobacterium gelidilacus]